MGAHRGHAIPRDGDYVALAIHQAARIAGAASGSQILLSESVGRAVSERGGHDIRSIGRWRVRDFDEPEELFVVQGAEVQLRSDEPRLIPAVGHNIVRPRDRFVAREQDQSALLGALHSGHLVTVVGPPGVGKTRLVIETVVRDVARWPDGIWHAALGQVERAQDVEAVLVSSIAPPGAGPLDDWSDVRASLSQATALVVLDNCEHVVEAVAPLVSDLLSSCRNVGVVATSREPLSSSSPIQLDEKVLRLAPLAVGRPPDPGAGVPARSPAAQLFVERAGLVDWSPDERDEADIDKLCRALDGLPLAIELAASWAEVLSPAELCEAFADPEQWAGLQSRTPHGSRPSLSDAIEWSRDRLDPTARRTLSAVSVFSGTFSLEAAANVAARGSLDQSRTRLELFDLVTKSLVVKDRVDGASRYRLLNPMREHIVRRSSVDELRQAQRCAADYYQATLGPSECFDRRWSATMSTELENVVALVAADAVSAEVRLTLAWSIGSYRDLTDRFGSGIAEITRSLSAIDAPLPARAALMTLAADLAIRIGDFVLAQRHLSDAEKLAASVGLPDWDDAALYRTRAALALWRGDPARCGEIAAQGLAARLSERGRARLHDVRGIALMHLGDPRSAAADFTAELAMWEELQYEIKACTTHGNLAEAKLQLGDFEGAARHQLHCLELAREFGQAVWIAHSATMAAQLAARREDWPQALILQRAADAEYERIGLRLFVSDESAHAELMEKASANRSTNGDAGRSDGATVDSQSLIEVTIEQLRQLSGG